ncbi:hypothetical protein [Fibrobacter sp. UWB12]|uniref:hypothetical protein n=1 Tax=Fibrobacter sp. UWB12 TaxID=1896203 RepID=UPI000916095C|nr:hypothetical protein [Fibrobacter sp. UWB12]SHK82496.1 hypothetical protein SAMN05720759_10725 [Fibrobacter sp. UWB12]
MKTRLTSNLLFGLATASILAVPALAQEAEAASKGPEVKFSGEVEFDAYTGDVINDDTQSHSYASTFDLNVDVKFNEKWSASVQLEADGETTDPAAIYNGAFVQYTHSDKFAVKFGDLTFSEGAFLNFYDYDDPADNAAGMAEHDIRGFEIDYNGLVFGLGFGRGDNDNQVCVEEGDEEACVGVAYDLHLAYELGVGEHVLRPFIDYKSYQEAKHNELHAGLDANLKFDAFTFHFVYGLHVDALKEDDPKATHALLAEPALDLGTFSIKASVLYAIFDDKTPTVHGEEIPEYFFVYGEPSVKINDALALGLPLEYHTNTIDKDDDVSTFNVGLRAYFTPVEGLEVTGFAKFNIPVGDDAGDDTGLGFGLETVFAF